MRGILLFTCLWITFRSAAQCTYPATLRTSPNYCLGATLSVISPHALSKIVWYQGNTPVKTALSTSQPGVMSETALGKQVPTTDEPANSNLFVDEGGSIYLADYGGHRVIKWTPGAAEWITVAGGNGVGTGANQLSYPWACVVDKAGNVYVSDNAFRVTKWAPGASVGITVAGGHGPGSDADQLRDASALALDCEGNLYIADANNNRIQRWAPGATEGITVAGGNGLGNAANQLALPNAVWVDGSGNVYVGDQVNSRVQKWAPGAAAGVTVAGGNGSGSNANQLASACALFVDNAQNVYINDLGNNRIQKWTPGATEGVTVASPALYSPFAGAIGVFIDDKGTIYGGGTGVEVTQTSVILLQLTQPSTIDNTFTPATGGLFHAVVTDINGYVMTTDTIPIDAPPAGPPSIAISASATNVVICESVNFTATVTNGGNDPAYQWQVSGVNVGGDSLTYRNNLFANGDEVSCILTAVGVSCQLVEDTSNVITLAVDPQGHATVSITTPDASVCAGTPVTVTATVTNGSATPVLEWFVNGQATGDTTTLYTDSGQAGNEIVYCLITSDASCGLAKSNSIPIAIYPFPVIVAGQVFDVQYGKGLTLAPDITGDIVSYQWSPGTGLSDSTIRDPVADPVSSMVYQLQVVSMGGCKTSGAITVDVYTPVSVPNAFTPNGDGHNDRFYVLEGPQNSIIREFAVFNRWGSKVFDVHDGIPGDPRYGWDGYYDGKPAAADTYVYMVVMKIPGGGQKIYKGTVLLIR